MGSNPAKVLAKAGGGTGREGRGCSGHLVPKELAKAGQKSPERLEATPSVENVAASLSRTYTHPGLLPETKWCSRKWVYYGTGFSWVRSLGTWYVDLHVSWVPWQDFASVEILYRAAHAGFCPYPPLHSLTTSLGYSCMEPNMRLTFLFLGMGSSKRRLLVSASSMPSSGWEGVRKGLKLSADRGGDGVDGLD